MAFDISVVWARPAPWSGRSDATMKSGLPEPLYCTGPHDDDGSGVTALADLVALLAVPARAANATATRIAPATAPTERRAFTLPPRSPNGARREPQSPPCGCASIRPGADGFKVRPVEIRSTQ